MSLNGLEASAVVEAHQAVLAEPGGWLLLKYTNRDTVDVLSRGNGGIPEVRNAVTNYVEKSPLYGLLQYRRKRIILKYVPEGTSRLLQVRLTVHFQAILDSFIPHETVFTFHAPSELSDSALGLCTMLLASAGSLTSSTSSVRRPRLDEITEDAEEGPPQSVMTEMVPKVVPVQEQTTEIDLVGLPASAIRAKALLARRREQEAEDAAILGISTVTTPTSARANTSRKLDPELNHKDISYPPRKESLSPRKTPKVPISTSPAIPANDQLLPITSEPAASVIGKGLYARLDDDSQFKYEPEKVENTEPTPASEALLLPMSNNFSSANTSSISQWTNDVAAYTLPPLPKKKKKLAPRPHVDVHTRPKTSGSSDEPIASRRVANLPTSVRISARPGSQQSTRSVPMQFSPANDDAPPMPNPGLSQFRYRSPENRPPPSITSSAAADFSSVAPEKLRLMKALQLRKRNQMLSSRAQSAASGLSGRYVNTDSFPSGEGSASSPDTITTQSPNINSMTPQHVRTLDNNKYGLTASPTSTVTTSENISTKPSSISDGTDGRVSKDFMSSETNSSSTPKANNGKPTLATIPHINTISDMDEDDADRELNQKSTTPQASPIEEAFMRLTGADNTPKPGTPVDEHYLSDVGSRPGAARGLKTPPPTTNINLDPLSAGGRKHRGLDNSLEVRSSEEFDVSGDDAFMDELQNATVLEAKPMSMSIARSPPTEIQTRSTPDKAKSIRRALSLATNVTTESSAPTTDDTLTASKAGSTRSISTALPQWPPAPKDTTSGVSSKKPVLSHGISTRIKALEVISSRESAPTSTLPPPESISHKTGLSSLMKRASFISPTPPNKYSEKHPAGRPQPQLQTMDATSGDTSRPWVQRQGSIAEIYPPSHKGETISVTARIVRDRHVPGIQTGSQNDPVLHLHRSPLIVEHDNLNHPQTKVRNQSHSSDITSRTWNTERGTFPISSHQSGSQTRLPPSESLTSRISFTSSHKKKTATTASETSSITEEKKQSRTYRMMRRLSGFANRRPQKNQLTSATRESLVSNTTTKAMEGSGQKILPTEDFTLHVVDVGDVNVQFPGSLLWKRRFLRIDDQGNLIFAASSNDNTSRGINRRYHLAEVKPLTMPDHEREEMAWSIFLDLRDGGCIQCACESKQAQQHVLNMLIDAQNAYEQLYGL